MVSRRKKRLSLLQILIGIVVLLAVQLVWAIPHRMEIRPLPLNRYIAKGAVVGGQAHSQFSLLKIDHATSPKGERVMISYGDLLGQPLDSLPGYFHVEFDSDRKRLVMDLAQVQKTAIDPKELTKIFSRSKLIANVDLSMDPEDSSTTLIVNLKQSADARVSLGDQPSEVHKVFIDFRPKDGSHF